MPDSGTMAFAEISISIDGLPKPSVTERIEIPDGSEEEFAKYLEKHPLIPARYLIEIFNLNLKQGINLNTSKKKCK